MPFGRNSAHIRCAPTSRLAQMLELYNVKPERRGAPAQSSYGAENLSNQNESLSCRFGSLAKQCIWLVWGGMVVGGLWVVCMIVHTIMVAVLARGCEKSVSTIPPTETKGRFTPGI